MSFNKVNILSILIGMGVFAIICINYRDIIKESFNKINLKINKDKINSYNL